jgi:hypothetical protein
MKKHAYLAALLVVPSFVVSAPALAQDESGPSRSNAQSHEADEHRGGGANSGHRQDSPDASRRDRHDQNSNANSGRRQRGRDASDASHGRHRRGSHDSRSER